MAELFLCLEIAIGGANIASLILTDGEEEFTWKITGLSKTFTTGNGYVSAGITAYRFTQQADSISGIVDSKNATSSGSTTVGPRTISYEPGTYTFWAYTETRDMGYWPAGSATVTITSASVRPDYWDWWSTIRRGYDIEITANEWNSFCSRINEVRAYYDVREYSFDRVYRGDAISADVINQARSAIYACGPNSSYGPGWISPGDPITASYFNDLRDYLNSNFLKEISMEDHLIRLAQLRSILHEVHTSGEDTLRMANALALLENTISVVPNSINKDAHSSKDEAQGG